MQRTFCSKGRSRKAAVRPRGCALFANQIHVPALLTQPLGLSKHRASRPSCRARPTLMKRVKPVMGWEGANILGTVELWPRPCVQEAWGLRRPEGLPEDTCPVPGGLEARSPCPGAAGLLCREETPLLWEPQLLTDSRECGCWGQDHSLMAMASSAPSPGSVPLLCWSFTGQGPQIPTLSWPLHPLEPCLLRSKTGAL